MFTQRSVVRMFIFAVAVLTVTGLQANVAVGTIIGSTSSGPIKGYVVFIDVSHGVYTPHVTPPEIGCKEKGSRVRPETAVSFADSHLLFFATTANTGEHPAPLPLSCAKPDGLIMSDGVIVSPLVMNGPAMVFDSTARATIGKLITIPTGTRNAVAGTTSVGDDCPGDPKPPGGLLVQNGKPGPCIIPKSQVLAPRTAAGVNKDGILIFVTIAGDENANIGLLTFDMANLMIGLGAVNAVNFDGGGSSAFVWIPGHHSPPESKKLVDLMAAAHVPARLPNPHNLFFSVTWHDPAKPLCYCAENQSTDCGGGGCRRVYANLGFTYQAAAPAAVHPRK